MKLDRKPRPQLSLAPDAPTLARGRVHEATGPASLVFAALVARKLEGPIIWARPAWARSSLNPEGLSALFDPARLVVVHAPRPLDILWTAEEALRSGAAPLVVAEPVEPAALTPLRRLQLAAEAGGGAGSGPPPLGLLLPPRSGVAGAIESRWMCEPTPSWRAAQEARWRFSRIYAKAGPPSVWETGVAALSREESVRRKVA